DLSSEMIQIWGLTGGIASGKSTVARIFAENGIGVLDADALTRELSAPGGAAHAAIEKRFGTADRSRLREMVFRDPQARKDLEGILHPLIRLESERRIRDALSERMAKGERLPLRMIYEATLLVETGRHK